MRRKKSKLPALFALILLSALSVAGYIVFHDLKGPTINVELPAAESIGLKQNIYVQVTDISHVKSVSVAVLRGSKRMELMSFSLENEVKNYEFDFTLEETKLPMGKCTLEITASDASYANFGQGNESVALVELDIDNEAPKLSVKTLPPYIRRGGSGLIVYSSSEELSKTGVYIEDAFYPAYKQESGLYVCMLPFPLALASATDFIPQIVAQDLAGNITESRLIVQALNKNYREDTLKVSDGFLESKADVLNAFSNAPTLLEKYIDMNNNERDKNFQKILELTTNSHPKALWEGRFVTLPRSIPKAYFGDYRNYVYNGEVVDNQIHMGIDLASVRAADIPAANNGVVIFTGDIGIYGKVVIIDHGLNVFTLYSHLTDINVNEGMTLKTGDIVGTTGITGLAGGDHVHFGVLIGGVAVEPKEWMDANWLKNNITSRLQKAE